MITKAQVKHIRSLADKKYRNECKEFVVEGEKMIEELLNSSCRINELFATEIWMKKNLHFADKYSIIQITEEELKKISHLTTPNHVLSTVHFIEKKQQHDIKISIVLDTIQDPGNLGSIIRIADWFGINNIFCSVDTVDKYNTKVVQSSMGGIFRINIEYVDIEKLLHENQNIPSYVATLNGENLSKFKKIKKAFIIIGNESKGVDKKIISLCTHKITIPKLGNAESLNAAIATGIICYSMLE